MTPVRKLRVRNRLGAMILDGSGVSFARATAQAEKALEAMRPGLMVSLREQIEGLAGRYGEIAGAGRDGADFMAVYNDVMAIIDLSAAAPGAGVDQAAHSLCDVIDRCAMADRWDWPAVEVHISALQLLASEAPLDAAARQGMLDGLTKVARKAAAGRDAAG